MRDDLSLELRARAAYEKLRDLALNFSTDHKATDAARRVFMQDSLLAWEDMPSEVREEWRLVILASDAALEEKSVPVTQEELDEAEREFP